MRRAWSDELEVAIGRHHPQQGPSGGDSIGPNPTDRAKNGTKRSILVESSGAPLAVSVAVANVRDDPLLKPTLQAIVVKRPKPRLWHQQNICLDKGYDNQIGDIVAGQFGYVKHICRKKDERKPIQSHER
jgi:putative transposase